MGSVDIANAKREDDSSLRETAGDVFSAALAVMSNLRNRFTRPLREGVPVPRFRRAASAAGQVVGRAVNKVDVSLGDRHPGPTIGTWLTAHGRGASISDQLLASVGAAEMAAVTTPSSTNETTSYDEEAVNGANAYLQEAGGNLVRVDDTDTGVLVTVNRRILARQSFPELEGLGRREGHL